MPKWTERHSAFTLFMIVWALGLTTWVTWRVFSPEPPNIPGTTAVAFATLFALPALAVGLWKWRHDRNKDKE